MKKPIRYFAIGLFTASLILFIASYFLEPEIITEEESIDQLISSIEASGYRVISESEYITLSVSTKEKVESDQEKEEEKETVKKNDDKKEQVEKEPKDESKEKTEEEKKVIKYTLTIKENMLPSIVADLLAENKIVDNAKEFNKYLEDEGYSQRIQIGKHNVTSDMSMKEIAEELIKFN